MEYPFNSKAVLVTSKTLVRVLLVLCTMFGVLSVPATSVATESDGTFSAWDFVTPNPSVRYSPIVGFFNDDDYSDILWYAPGSNQEEIWMGSKVLGRFRHERISVGGSYRPIVGDFAGSELTDILFYCPGSCADVMWIANGQPSIFDKRPVSVGGNYVVPTITATTRSSFPGAYVLRDFEGGKDDILWWAGSAPGVKDVYWRFSDNGSGKFSPSTFQVNSDVIPIVGNFSAGKRYEDILLYGPGGIADALWTSNGAGGFAKRSIRINGWFNPATIFQHGILKPRLGGRVVPQDSVLWYDVRGCGRSSVVWRFRSNGLWLTRNASPWWLDEPPYRARCDGDDRLFPYEGSSGVIVKSNSGTSFVLDYNDCTVTALYGDFVSGAGLAKVADFNGDGNSDVLWYVPGVGDGTIFFPNRYLGGGVSTDHWQRGSYQISAGIPLCRS